MQDWRASHPIATALSSSLAPPLRAMSELNSGLILVFRVRGSVWRRFFSHRRPPAALPELAQAADFSRGVGFRGSSWSLQSPALPALSLHCRKVPVCLSVQKSGCMCGWLRYGFSAFGGRFDASPPPHP